MSDFVQIDDMSGIEDRSQEEAEAVMLLLQGKSVKEIAAATGKRLYKLPIKL